MRIQRNGWRNVRLTKLPQRAAQQTRPFCCTVYILHQPRHSFACGFCVCWL